MHMSNFEIGRIDAWRVGRLIAGAACFLYAAASPAADPAPAWQSFTDIVKESPAADWRTPDPANTLYVELPSGRVIIELAPAFAPLHVDNVKTLVKERF